MSKAQSIVLSKNLHKNLSGWDVAVSDAERMLRQAKERVEDLKRSVHTLKQLRDSGAPFPGEQSKQSEANT